MTGENFHDIDEEEVCSLLAPIKNVYVNVLPAFKIQIITT